MCKTIELRRTGLYNNVLSVTSTHYEDRPLTKQTCTSQREYNGVPTFLYKNIYNFHTLWNVHTFICTCNVKIHINVHTCITCRYWIHLLIMNKYNLHVYQRDTYRSSLGCWYYASSLWRGGTAAPPRGFLGGYPELHWAWASLGWWASHCRRACRTWCCLVWRTQYKRSIAPDAAWQRFHQLMYLQKSQFSNQRRTWIHCLLLSSIQILFLTETWVKNFFIVWFSNIFALCLGNTFEEIID